MDEQYLGHWFPRQRLPSREKKLRQYPFSYTWNVLKKGEHTNGHSCKIIRRDRASIQDATVSMRLSGVRGVGPWKMVIWEGKAKSQRLETRIIEVLVRLNLAGEELSVPFEALPYFVRMEGILSLHETGSDRAVCALWRVTFIIYFYENVASLLEPPRQECSFDMACNSLLSILVQNNL